MTLFLRNKNRQSVVDIEIWNKDVIDLRVATDLKLYSEILLSLPEGRQQDCIADFNYIDTLRQWLFEYYEFEIKNDGHDFDNVVKEIKEQMLAMCHKYDLYFIVD